MTSNPMQRQARNSFLLGMLVAILIAGLIIAFLFIQLKNSQKELKAVNASMKQVYVLSQEVKSGDILTIDMFTKVSTKTAAIPANYVDISTLIDAYSLYTKDGTRILSRYEDGEQNLYLDDNENEKQQTKVEFDLESSKYYTEKDGTKQYIETATAPVVAKVAIPQNTIVTQSMIARSDEIQTADMRQQEYNMLVLPMDLVTDDFIDIRFMLPTGQDYIVVSKKRATIPVLDGAYVADTLQLQMREDEILSLSSAIVEAAQMEGAKLYVTKYIEAGTQPAATPTYIANAEVVKQLNSNPNLLQSAKETLKARYSNQGLIDLRNNGVNSALGTYGDTEKIAPSMQESVKSTLESRQQYLQTLVPDVQ